MNQIRIDPTAAFGLAGLPKEYETLLATTGISKEDAMANKEDVIGVLQFHMAGLPKMQTNKEIQKKLNKAIDFRNDDPRKYYDLGVRLGQGAGGIVYEAIDKRTRTKVALKQAIVEDFEEIKNEIATQTLSKHQNVVEFLETFNYNNDIWIVIELMNGGALTKLVGKQVLWKEENIAWVLKESLQGLENLHSNHRIHRDIKSDNILYDLSGRIKLADFGFAASLTKEAATRTSIVGYILSNFFSYFI